MSAAQAPCPAQPAQVPVTAKAALVVSAVAALLLGIGSAAWACIPQPRLVVVAPQASGPAGSQVSVQGIGFDSPPARTEVRWNTADGPVLGRAETADFTMTVTVPQAEPGSYGVLVLSRGADGVLGNTGRATFEVTSGDAASPPSRAMAPPPSSPGPTFAPAPAVAAASTGPSDLTLALVAVALVAVGVLVGTLVRPKHAPTEATP